MRTKNKKWIGPVPIAAVAALALAAFIAAGLLLAPGSAQNVEAQGFDTGANPLADTITKCQADLSGGDVHGGACTTTADSLDVYIFRANSNTADAGMRAYVTGGSDFPKVQGSTSTTIGDNVTVVPVADRLGKVGVDRHTIEFAQTTFSSRQEYKITVTRSMADAAGRVYVWGYNAPDGDNSDLAAASTSLQGSANVNIRVQFVGKPTFGVDSVCDTNEDVDGNTTDAQPSPVPAGCTSGSNDSEIRSQVTAAVTTGTAVTAAPNIDGKKDVEMAFDATNTDQTAVTTTVTVQDAATNPLDGEVTFTVTSNPASIASATRTRDTGSNGQATYRVDDLPLDESYRVEVAIMFKGGTGNLDMGKVIITRSGDPTTIVADTYSIACLVDGNNPATDAKRDDTFDTDATGCAPVDRFARKQMFVVKANLEDALGNTVGGNLTIDVEDVDKPLDTDAPIVVTAPIATSPNTKAWVYTVDKDAMLGEHDITLSSTAKDVADVVLPVSIAGPPASYMVTPMPDGGKIYTTTPSVDITVTAQDVNGGIPTFTGTNNQAQVFAAYGRVDGLNAGGNVALAAKTGAGTFTYIVPRDANANESFQISIGSGEMRQTIQVVYGAAPTEPGMPTSVSATADSDTAITVTWGAAPAMGSDVTGYTVQSQYAMADGTMSELMDVTDCADIMTMTCTASSLTADTEYTFSVTADNAIGTGDAATATATTLMTPTPPDATGTLDAVSLTMGSDETEAVDASGAFTMTEGDDITSYAATSGDETVATATADAAGMVTITAKGAGTATVSVTASDDDGESDPVTIAVTVAADPTPKLMAPTNVAPASFVAGQVNVAWTPGQDAQGHIVVLFDASDNIVASRGAGATADSADLNNVAAGSYDVVVVSYRSTPDSEFKLSAGVSVTVR